MRRHALFILALIWSAQAHAGGFSIDEQDAEATGRAGTAGARGGVSSIYFNPSGLTEIDGVEAKIGATAFVPSVTATDASGHATAANTSLFVPPYAYVGGAWGSVGVGVSFNAPFGLGVTWPSTFEDRYEVESTSFQSLAVMAGLAYRIIRPLSVGLTAGAVNTRIDVRKALDFVTQDGTAEIAASGWGFAAGAGLQYRVTDAVTLGLSGFLPTPTTMDGTARFSGVPESFQPLTPDQGVTTSLTLPARLRAAGSVQPTPSLRVDLDVEYTLWSSLKTFDVTFADPSPAGISEAKDWRNTVTARLGGEYTWPSILTARAGLAFDGQAAPSSTLGPDSPDGPRGEVSVGVGRELGAGFRADLAYAFILLASTRSTEPNFPASYQGNAQVIGLSLGWRWAPAPAAP